MEPKQAIIQEDTNRLINSLNRGATEEQKDSMRSYARKILASGLGRQVTETASELRQQIIEKVRTYADTATVLQCQEASQRFLSMQSITKKAEVFKMLFKLSEALNNSAQSFSSLFGDPQKSLNFSQNTTMNATQSQIQSMVSPLKDMKVSNVVGLNNGANPIAQKKGILQHQQLEVVRFRGYNSPNSVLKVTQLDLLRELCYVFQNVNSDYFIEEDTYYVLKPEIQVFEPVRRITTELAEIGWLYKKIKGGLKEEGTVWKALSLAVQEELREYYRWLATIENTIKNQQMTLRKLLFWSYEPFEKLRWLGIIMDVSQPYSGCQLISVINTYRPQGSKTINELLNRLLGQLLQPLLQYIYNWVYKGELVDAKKEFFIREDPKTLQCQIWTKRFTLVEEYIPNILDSQSATAIFNAGKANYFLRNSCRVNFQLDVPFIDTKSILDTEIVQSTSILSVGFRKWLNSVAEETNKALLNVLTKQFALMTHLQSMRNFFLLGKGDFIQHLYESLKEELSKPKTQIYEMTLDSFIFEAISKCFPAEKPPKTGTDRSIRTDHVLFDDRVDPNSYRSAVLNRLLAKKVGHGNDGWECFNFKYELQSIQSIETVITPESTLNYQRIFSFLWKVKRVEQGVKQVWVNHMKSYSREVEGTPITSRLLFDCNLLRHTMSHFINCLFGYLMIAIEAAWKQFYDSVLQAKDLDSLLALHENFQQQVLDITMNTPKLKNISESLDKVLTQIMQFKALQGRIQSQFEEYAEQCRRYQNNLNVMARGLMAQEQMAPPTLNYRPIELDLRKVKDDFNKAFQVFFKLICKDTESRLVALVFRLDFSEFYSSKTEDIRGSI